MILKNLMEDKKLDFSQPLMSVRRFSSTGAPLEAEEKNRNDETSKPTIPPLPVYKSELKSGPVRNPGTVPFQWEKIPGRPKDETKTPSQPFKKPPISPKLPPGRNSNVKDSKTRSESDENDAKETENQRSLNSGESDETYLDALDTLSRTESFFINCSVSGLSEFDGADLRQFSTFESDLQTRDFMIRRFLPAAKAMTSESPQYPIKRPNVQQNQPWELQKLVRGDRQQRRINPYAHMVSTNYADDIGNGGSDEEDNNSVYDYSSAKICGLLPRFCLLNPVPAMKSPAPRAISVRSARNISSRASSSNAVNSRINPKNSCQNIDRLSKQNAIVGAAEKRNSSKTNSHDSQRRCFREFLENDHDPVGPVAEKTLYIDSVHKLKSPESNSSSSELKGMTQHGEDDLDSSVSKLSDGRSLDLDKSWEDDRDRPLNLVQNSLKLTESSSVDRKNVNLERKVDGKTGIEERSDCVTKGSTTLRSSKENCDKTMDLRNQALRTVSLAPPLPKSPSESWLKRTLPALSRSSPSSRLYAQNTAWKMSSYDPNKDSNVSHGNLLFSEVLLATIPEV